MDAAEALGHAAGAATVEDLLDHGPVLGGEGADLLRGRLGVGHGLGGQPQGGVTGLGGAQAGALEAPHHEGTAATRQVAGVFDLGHGADGREAIVDAGHEEEPAGVLHGLIGRRAGLWRLQRDGDDHPGAHHAGGQREDRIGECGLVHGGCNSYYRAAIRPGCRFRVRGRPGP